MAMATSLASSVYAGAANASLKVQGLSSKSSNGVPGMQAVASTRLGVAGNSVQLQVAYPFWRPSSRNSHSLCVCSYLTASEEISVSDKAAKEEAEEDLSPLTPNAFEVQSLLMEVCDETSIAELKLKVGPFTLHMKRDIAKPKGTVAPPTVAAAVPPPVPSNSKVDSTPAPSVPASSKSHYSTSSLVLASSSTSKPASLYGLLEAAADAGLLFITSPKVGFFRKGRTVKGQTGKPLCQEGHMIQEGEVVCYLEQLGTQQPVEAETSGEVVKVLWKDGEPVGYGDPLIAIRPPFPGIKKLT